MNSQIPVAVKADLPQKLSRLDELALNLRWTWDPDADAVFERIAPEQWRFSRRNPVRLLRGADASRLEELASDREFLELYDRAVAGLDTYLGEEDTWFRQQFGGSSSGNIAYFCAEFGLTEGLPIYSGGLGVLAGDHLKSASDLGIPLVAVGLFYREGYFSQRLDSEKGQEESFPAADPADLPMVEATDGDGSPIVVRIPFPGREVHAKVWRVQVGRVPLLLLDSNVEENSDEDRQLTARLYGGDRAMRLSQELILGVGGYRALEASEHRIGAYHMNEGHSALLVLEHVRQRLEEGATLEEARESAGSELIFTTHTPVAAGHDEFTPELTERLLRDYRSELGLDRKELLALAQRPGKTAGPFCMTCLALRTAQHANGVSRMHGAVSRRMWAGVWPDLDEEEVPIGHVTNGIHRGTWVAEGAADAGASGDAAALWEFRNTARRRLVEFVRHRLQNGQAATGENGGAALDPDALTIGFARRFTTYKRATLVLSDLERFGRILEDSERPVQLIFAGKAHPKDEPGKGLLRRVLEITEQPPFAGRVVILEGYDMQIARYLVQGVDVWLNTPRPPKEASGTSGMKAAANGGLNLSTFDGWWAEAWREHNDGPAPIGWVIGPRPEDGGTEVSSLSEAERDRADVESLYQLLENEVVPSFYRRNADGLPEEWLAMVRASMTSLVPFFDTDRMLRDYSTDYYVPALAPEMAAQ